jgi:hypothetical protein
MLIFVEPSHRLSWPPASEPQEATGPRLRRIADKVSRGKDDLKKTGAVVAPGFRVMPDIQLAVAFLLEVASLEIPNNNGMLSIRVGPGLKMCLRELEDVLKSETSQVSFNASLVAILRAWVESHRDELSEQAAFNLLFDQMPRISNGLNRLRS